MTVAAPSTRAPRDIVRTVVRDVLSGSGDYQSLDPSTRRHIARGLVQICSAALALDAEVGASTSAAPNAAPFARAQSAGDAFSGVSASRVAGTTREILEAVSFPRFVTELITGVFKALVDSNQQQLDAYVDLIRNVAATTDGFADSNVGLDGARRWLAERFAGSFVLEGAPAPQRTATEDDWESAGDDEGPRLTLRPGASRPTEAALRTALGLTAQDSVPGGDPERLVPLARVALARNRQQMLSTMVMLGLQRIVIDSGRLHAAMRFHIDTRSAASDDRGSRFDLQNQVKASGGLQVGPWGMRAEVQNTIGYVTTQRTQTTEEMNTELDLNSSVELVFRTDYLPLERLAGQGTVDRIRVNTLNPAEELRAATASRQTLRADQRQSERARLDNLNTGLTGRATAPAPASGARSPATTSPATTSPATTRAGTTSPATTSPATTSPATTRAGTTSPATTSPATTRAGTTSPATTSPATTSPATTSPGPTRPASPLPPNQAGQR